MARLSQRSLALSGTTKSQYYYYEISDDWNDTTLVTSYKDMLDSWYSFTYDKNGNIINDGSYYYSYDAIGQLVEVGDSVDYKEYVYDDRGNIRQKLIYNSDFDLVDSVVYGYGNSTWTDALTSYDGESFSYDAMGNPLNWRGGRTLTWTNGRNLASMGGVTFSYDADGLRTGKTSSSKSTAYYALNGKYVGEKTVINGTTYYISYYYDENGAPMGINVNGSAYFFVKNLQGDITAIMSYTGTVVAKYTYDAWGKLLSVRDGNNANVTSATHIANLNPFRYRGYIYDTETGLYYLNSRYYDASVGRFISPDSADVVTVTKGIYDKNLYAYCDNNPVMRVDTAGYFWDIFFDVVSLVASVVEVVANPTDGGAWLGLAGDVVDLVPFVTGVGETVKAVRTIDKVADAVDTAHDVGKAVDKVDDVKDTVEAGVSTAKKGWYLGDDITTLTKAGKDPTWSTVKSRYWKNEALNHADDYTKSNLDRMVKGLAPQVSLNGKMYSMELHHITPRRLGGSNAYDNLLKVTPWKHAEIDPFRHFTP